jgi:hypothetical protein
LEKRPGNPVAAVDNFPPLRLGFADIALLDQQAGHYDHPADFNWRLGLGKSEGGRIYPETPAMVPIRPSATPKNKPSEI